MECFRFWKAKVVICGYFGSPGAPFGAPGRHFDGFCVCCDFDAFRDEKVVPF